MVKLALQIKATSENIKSIEKPDEDFRWHVKLKSKNSETDKFIYIIQSNEVEKSGSKGTTVNHVQKIDGSEVSVTILPDKVSAYAFEFDEQDEDAGPIAGQFLTVCAFECRGCEVSNFMFSDGWNIVGKDGSRFEDVDLSDDWYDVGENGEPVSLTELEFQIVKIK